MPRNSSSRQTNSKVNIPKPIVPAPPPLKNQSLPIISTIQRNPNGGLMENIKQGFAFGAGNALSRVFIDKIVGNNNGNIQPKTTNINMDELQKKYLECVNYASNSEESEKCEMYKKHLVI
jgi:hypothetical protein